MCSLQQQQSSSGCACSASLCEVSTIYKLAAAVAAPVAAVSMRQQLYDLAAAAAMQQLDRLQLCLRQLL